VTVGRRTRPCLPSKAPPKKVQNDCPMMAPARSSNQWRPGACQWPAHSAASGSSGVPQEAAKAPRADGHRGTPAHVDCPLNLAPAIRDDGEKWRPSRRAQALRGKRVRVEMGGTASRVRCHSRPRDRHLKTPRAAVLAACPSLSTVWSVRCSDRSETPCLELRSTGTTSSRSVGYTGPMNVQETILPQADTCA